MTTTPCNGFMEAIGNTPLIHLANISKTVGRNIYVKAEFMNPGGSIKDRAALYLIRDAEMNHGLKPGGTVVEGTAGNTGIGLAHACKSRGYKCVIYLPNTQSKLKIETLRLLGAEVHAVPAVPFANVNNFNHQAKRHAEQLDNAVWTNQFDNLSNSQAHFETTGPEIYELLQGKIDAFTCSAGTGGTFAGTTRYLKDKSNGKVKCILADPPGAMLYNFVKTGELVAQGKSSFTEGIGLGRITKQLEPVMDLLDDAIHIPDQTSINMLYELLDTEGLFVGGTSALNVAAAIEVAKTLPPDSNVVTILPDSAHKYSDRLFSTQWLKEKGIYDGISEHLKSYIIYP